VRRKGYSAGTAAATSRTCRDRVTLEAVSCPVCRRQALASKAVLLNISPATLHASAGRSLRGSGCEKAGLFASDRYDQLAAACRAWLTTPGSPAHRRGHPTPKLVRPAGQVPVRSVDAYFFQGRSISNG